jgi:poly-gamma-glutamate synthesis protein (capsule biosynthesis protein)
MRRWPATADALLVAASVVLLVLAVRAGGSSASTTRQVSAPLTVKTAVDGWRAPGVKVPVTGFAGPNEQVVLRADGRLVDREISGPRGRYSLRFAAAKPGRYHLVVAAGDRTAAAGAVVVRAVVLDAVGDVTFGEQVGPAMLTYGPAYPWRYVARTLRAADITTGNLETSVSTQGMAAEKKYTFRGSPAALRPMHDRAGFDVLTLANNHAVDYGRDALLDTIGYAHEAGIKTIGAGRTSFAARRPAIVDAGGLRVALLGYSDINPAGFNATETSPGTAKADLTAIRDDVRAARRHADVVVCFFHWGVELHPDPDSRQELYASACLDAGAKLVLGAHPHVLGPVSRPTPHSLVAWTLGNFVFPSSGVTGRTAILKVTLDTRGVSGYRLVPVTIDGFTPHLGG